MSKKTALRFYVAEGNRCSSTWSLTIQRNDIYLSHSGSAQDKFSLHESGSYQWSVRSEHQSNVPFAQVDRHIAKWAGPSAPPGSLTRQFFVLIPTSELQQGRKRTAKQAVLLRAPPLGWATSIEFLFVAPDTGKTIESATWNVAPIFEERLADGRLLVIISSHIPVDKSTAAKIVAVKAASLEEGSKHQTDVARALMSHRDELGVHGIVEVSVKGETGTSS